MLSPCVLIARQVFGFSRGAVQSINNFLLIAFPFAGSSVCQQDSLKPGMTAQGPGRPSWEVQPRSGGRRSGRFWNVCTGDLGGGTCLRPSRGVSGSGPQGTRDFVG